MKNPDFCFMVILLFAVLVFPACKNSRATTSFEAMNTFMTLQTYGRKAEKANKSVEERIIQIENNISTTNPASDIYKLNHSHQKSLNTKDETFNLVDYALNFANTCDGTLNISLYPIIKAWGFTTGEYVVPSQELIDQLLKNTDYTKIKLSAESHNISLTPKMELDLGAIGKGYAGDEAIKILRSYGVKSALLDLGGNIQTIGVKPDGSEWTIGIKNPWGGPAVMGLKINNQAVVTSGGYERFFTDENGKKYIHIFNSETGYPVENEIASTTIVCENGLYADALSTTMFAMGTEKAINYWRNHQDFEIIILTNNQNVYYTKGLERKIMLLYDFASVSIIE